MTEVAKFVPKEVTKHEGVMKTLANFAVIAENENLTGIAIAAVSADGYTHSAFEGGTNIATLLGAIARLQRRVSDYDAPD